MVTIDAPYLPQRDVAALLQEAAPLPAEMCRPRSASSVPHFSASFLAVTEERLTGDQASDHHIRELLHEYQQRSGGYEQHEVAPDGDAATGEKYERGVPAHGDAMFHNFVTRVQQNPGQVLRYARGGRPLMLYPERAPGECALCRGELVFELQVSVAVRLVS